MRLSPRPPVLIARSLPLGGTRLVCGRLLPVMRDDRGWSYTRAGAMRTTDATGDLLGALAMPRLVRCLGAAAVLLGGPVSSSTIWGESGPPPGES